MKVKPAGLYKAQIELVDVEFSHDSVRAKKICIKGKNEVIIKSWLSLQGAKRSQAIIAYVICKYLTSEYCRYDRTTFISCWAITKVYVFSYRGRCDYCIRQLSGRNGVIGAQCNMCVILTRTDEINDYFKHCSFLMKLPFIHVASLIGLPYTFRDQNTYNSKVNVWCGLMLNTVIAPFLFTNPTLSAIIYLNMLEHYAVLQLENF